MKERPILMSAPMVRAILRDTDTKTQTRRVIKPRLVCECEQPDWRPSRIDWIGYKYEGRDGWFCHKCGSGLRAIDEWSSHGILCPYGQPGDRLWVRETWRQDAKGGELAHYKADENGRGYWIGKWHPSIFMPRWASRITLEIVSVRVERLQDISFDDALAEGMEHSIIMHNPIDDLFVPLWDSINYKKHPWESNPWVWVIEFKRLP